MTTYSELHEDYLNESFFHFENYFLILLFSAVKKISHNMSFYSSTTIIRCTNSSLHFSVYSGHSSFFSLFLR